MLNYNEELRLLLEICIMLLKANRKTISGKELDSICETHFKANRVAGRLSMLTDKLGLTETLAIPTVSVRNGLEFDKIELRYPIWVYEEMLKEMLHNKERKSYGNMIVPGVLSYKEFEARKHIIEEKFEYIGKNINGKKIAGIGKHAIKLDDDFHNYLPEDMFLRKEMVTAGCDGCEIALAIIKKYGDLNNHHLKYITKDVEVEEEKEEVPSQKSSSKSDREIIQFLFENKYCYLGKKIRGLDIWGIGKHAITLGNISINAHSDGTPTGCGPIRQCHNKKFHNYYRKMKNKNSFDDGIELAKEIIQKYGYLSWEEEGEKYKKEMNEMYGDY